MKNTNEQAKNVSRILAQLQRMHHDVVVDLNGYLTFSEQENLRTAIESAIKGIQKYYNKKDVECNCDVIIPHTCPVHGWDKK
jgi:hypothetical protein